MGKGRGLALALVLVLLSVIAHSAAAGSLPDLPGMFGAIAVSTALAFALSGKRRSIVWLMGYLIAGQLLVHLAMSAMGHHAGSLIPDAQMLGGHIAAALVAAVFFARSESIVTYWSRAARRALGAPVIDVPAVERRKASIVRGSDVLYVDQVFRDVGPSRGPPVRSLVALTHA